MLRILSRDLKLHREHAARSVFMGFGGLFLLIESFEVVTTGDIQLAYLLFLVFGVVSGLSWFYLDGHYLSGFLKQTTTIKNKHIDTPITIKFGDLFSEPGWKAIGANDFFDSIVDGDLVSPSSLHGHVLTTFWKSDIPDWEKQVQEAIQNTEAEEVQRAKGNNKRFPIGTTAPVVNGKDKFLVVALTNTNPNDNITTAKTNDLILAVRGLLNCARRKCANEPLVIPLLGSGLARIGIDNAILVDLILAAIVEESKQLKVTSSIVIVLPKEKADEINLGAISRDWS